MCLTNGLLDVVEIGVSQLVSSMSLDTDEQIQIREQEELDEMLDEYMNYHEIKKTQIKPDLGTWLNI
jgi:hypothetical protein